MAQKDVKVKVVHKGSEEAFFAERDKKLLEALREKAAKECSEKYCEEHKYHCFRCGTQSLAEIDEGHVKIDICVNKDCGAVHLDPGELKELIAHQPALGSARKALFSLFGK